MKTIPDHVFRGYDLRGEVDKDLDEENVEILGKAYATWLLQRRIYDCVVGYDCRLTSVPYRDAIVKGLTESGVTVYDIGITLTQIAYFAQYVYRTRGLVMITASHNPKEYNGFKFGTGFSETMLTDDIIVFRELVKSGKFITKQPQGEHIQEDVFDTYLADLLRHIPAQNIGKFKIFVDSCAATTGIFLPKILRAVGCEVVEQNTKPDGNFPVGTPDPTERDVQERLADGVRKAKADLGFLYAKDILENLPGSKIVYNTLCSKQVDDVIRASGGIPIMWMTGHSFIKAKVREVNAPFGGELSGHFYFVDNFYGHDDGAIGTLRLLSYLTRIKKSLKQAVSELPHYISSPEIKAGCPDKIKFQVVSKELGGAIKKLYPTAKYVEIDGVRMDTQDEMMIIRASQNGPYLTVKFEGKTQESYDKLKTQVSEILHSNKNVDFSYGVNVDSLK